MDTKLNFHHLGVACRNIDATAAAYENLGYKRSETVFDPLQNVRICFLHHAEMPCVELLEPVDEKSPVVQILAKNGTAPYHTCYAVSDMETAVKELKAHRYLAVSKPQPACAIGNKRVAFLFHKDMGLIELVEK